MTNSKIENPNSTGQKRSIWYRFNSKKGYFHVLGLLYGAGFLLLGLWTLMLLIDPYEGGLSRSWRIAIQTIPNIHANFNHLLFFLSILALIQSNIARKKSVFTPDIIIVIVIFFCLKFLTGFFLQQWDHTSWTSYNISVILGYVQSPLMATIIWGIFAYKHQTDWISGSNLKVLMSIFSGLFTITFSMVVSSMLFNWQSLQKFILTSSILLCCGTGITGFKLFFNFSADSTENPFIQSMDYSHSMAQDNYRFKRSFNAGVKFLVLENLLSFGLNVYNQVVYGMDHRLQMGDPTWEFHENTIILRQSFHTLINALNFVVFLFLFIILLSSHAKWHAMDSKGMVDEIINKKEKNPLLAIVILCCITKFLEFFPGYFISALIQIIIPLPDPYIIQTTFYNITFFLQMLIKIALIIVGSITVSKYKANMRVLVLGGLTAFTSLFQIFEYSILSNIHMGFISGMLQSLCMIAWVLSLWWTFKNELALEVKTPLVETNLREEIPY